MLNLPSLALLMSGLLLCCVVAPLSAQSCTSCGPECVSACGSRRYRTCCFNYLRKRRSPGAPGMPAGEHADDEVPDDLRLQLVLVPNDRLPGGDQEGQDQYASLSLLHHLLQDPQEAGDGSAEATSAPAVAPAAPAPPSATLQRHRPGGGPGGAGAAGAGPAGKDWLSDLRRRVGLVYNV